MKYLISFFNKIRPWELIVISSICGGLFAFINFGLVLGCTLGPTGNLPCRFISHYYDIIDLDYYFSLSWFQLLVMVVFVLFLVKKIKRKRKSIEWTNVKLSFFIILSLALFSLSFNFSSKTLNYFTYEVADKNKFLKDWIVDCNEVVIKTPLFLYDPNEGQSEKKKDLYICSSDRYSRDHIYDIFGREMKK